MKSKILGCLSFFVACSAFADEVTDKSTGESFPTSVSFSADGKDYELDITGVATRKKLIIKVYSVAHYLQKNATGSGLEAIMSDENAKQLTIKWVRNVPAEKIQEGYRESFRNADIQADTNVDTYLSLFNHEAQKGDVHILRWIPGGKVEVEVNGKNVGTIEGAAFAKGLWSIWFGDKSVVKREALMSLLK